MTTYISLGGWCGTTMALRAHQLYREALPFDHVRCTFEGVIDCIDNDFVNFFPKKIETDEGRKCFRGKYISFFHHDLHDQEIRNDFRRRIDRLTRLLQTTNDRIVFVRTTVATDYQEEFDRYSEFEEVISRKYHGLRYVLVFIVPEQPQTSYYRSLDSNVFAFSLNDLSHDNRNLARDYAPIFEFLKENDLFTATPPEVDLVLAKRSRLWLIGGIPMVRNDN